MRSLRMRSRTCCEKPKEHMTAQQVLRTSELAWPVSSWQIVVAKTRESFFGLQDPARHRDNPESGDVTTLGNPDDVNVTASYFCSACSSLFCFICCSCIECSPFGLLVSMSHNLSANFEMKWGQTIRFSHNYSSISTMTNKKRQGAGVPMQELVYPSSL